MRIVIDARRYDMYLPITGPFHAATEMLVKRMASMLHRAGHDVHVLCAEPEEHYIDGVTWWPATRGPRKADLLITCDHALLTSGVKAADWLVQMTGIDPEVGPESKDARAFVVLSESHKKVLHQVTPSVPLDRIAVNLPGVDMPAETVEKVRHRLIWCNSPDRGLVHLARMWPRILEKVPDATIRVTYNVPQWVERTRWQGDELGFNALEIERWIRENPASVIAGVAAPTEVIREQQRAELYAYPMDPRVVGQAVHALAAEEAAAAGCALLLSHHEGLPEVYGTAADFLALPVNYDDWVEQIVGILKDFNRKRIMQTKARDYARTQPWSGWEQRWLDVVAKKVEVAV